MLKVVCGLAMLACCSAAFCDSNASKIESLYVVDQLNFRVRVVSPVDISVSTLAGNSVGVVVDGYGTSASFKTPLYSALSRDGNILYVNDGSCVRSVGLNNGFYAVKTLVGDCLVAGNVPGGVSVARLGATLRFASDVGDKGLFIADYINRQISYFDFQNKTLSRILGQSNAKIIFSFYYPNAIFVSKNGDFMLFASYVESHIIFVNLTSSTASIFAGYPTTGAQVDGVGQAARFDYISAIVGTADESKFYVADNVWKAVRVVTFPGAVVTTLPIAYASDFVNFMTLSMNGLFLYTVVVDSARNYYNKIDITAATYSKVGPNGAGYADGKMASVMFNKPTSCNIGYLYNFSTCSRCAVGEYQNVSVQTSLVCLKCPAGTYGSSVDSSACQGCAQGKYSSAVGLILSSSCQNCQAGSYASLQGVSVCTTCTPGSFSTGVGLSSSLCTACMLGYYASNAGASTCTFCSPGKYASQSAASTTCLVCAAGTFAIGGWTCQACYMGYYSDSPGADTCQLCPPGTFNPVTGMSSCQLCALGTNTNLDSQGATTCNSCIPGTYASSLGFADYNCPGCSAGSFASGSGASACTQCSAGGYCPVGSATAPTNCAAGTYSTVLGAVSAGNCVGCAAGTYCPSGSAAATNCSSGTFAGSGSFFCTNCPAFSSSPVGSSACACDAGRYMVVASGAVAVSDTYRADITSNWPSMGPGFPSYLTIAGKMNVLVAIGSSVVFALQPYAGAIVGLSLFSSLFESNQELMSDSNSITVNEHISATSSFANSQQFLYSVGVSGQNTDALAWDTSNVPGGIYYLMLTVGQSDKRYAVEVFAASLSPTTLTYYLNASFIGQITPTAACIGDTLVLDKVSSISTATMIVLCFPKGSANPSDFVFKAQGVSPVSWTVDSGVGATQCIIGMAADGGDMRLASVLSVYDRPTGNTVLPVSWSSFSCANCSAGSYSGSGASACSQCATGFTSQQGSSNCTEIPKVACPVGHYGVDPQCNPCPANTNSSGGLNLTVLNCRCLAGYVCTYTKRISVVLTLNSITWDMTTIAGLSQNAIVDAIAQAAGVPREKVVISSIFSGRRLLRLQRREVVVTVHGADKLDIDSVYRQLNVSHVAWTHRPSVHVARELI